MRSRERASKTPEHSGRFRRKPLCYMLLRRGVSRNLAAPNPPQGVSFCLFSLFFFFLFFLFRRRFVLQPQRFLGEFLRKNTSHLRNSTSISEKFHVYI